VCQRAHAAKNRREFGVEGTHSFGRWQFLRLPGVWVWGDVHPTVVVQSVFTVWNMKFEGRAFYSCWRLVGRRPC